MLASFFQHLFDSRQIIFGRSGRAAQKLRRKRPGFRSSARAANLSSLGRDLRCDENQVVNRERAKTVRHIRQPMPDDRPSDQCSAFASSP